MPIGRDQDTAISAAERADLAPSSNAAKSIAAMPRNTWELPGDRRIFVFALAISFLLHVFAYIGTPFMALALIEPIILVVMGLLVAFVLISLYMPIFSLGAGGIH